MRGKAREDVISRKQDPVQIERTLRNVCIGDGDLDPFCTEDATQFSYSHPVLERRFMERKILEELTNRRPMPWSHVAG